MKTHTRRLKPASALAVLFFVALSPAAARAQVSPAATRAAARADAEMRQRMLWDLEKLKRDRPERPNAARRPAYDEVAEEFKQLQLVNYSLSGLADPQVALDFARVRKESAEVRKHAGRLKGYLSLPEPENAQKQEKAAEIQTQEALRSALGRLDGLVNSFAWNPVFQHPDVVDLELSTKASRDLAGIIALSERIRRSAEELGKSLAKK
jgi:hypothetical protein